MRRRYLRTGVLAGFLILDACGFVLAFNLAFFTRFHWGPFLALFPVTKGYPGPAIYHQALYTLLTIWLIVFSYMGAYKELFVSGYDELVRILKGVIVCSLLSTA